MGTVKLMLVDDNVSLRGTLKRYFDTRQGVTVLGEASDGEEALELLRKCAPDAILLDLIMPKLDGMGVLRELRSSGNHSRIIMHTTLRSENVVAQAMALGADYYVAKPASPKTLHDCIVWLCGDGERRDGTPPPECERRVSELLEALCAGERQRGVDYLEWMARAVLKEGGDARGISKGLYPRAGEAFNVNWQCVERAARLAISAMWRRRAQTGFCQLLGMEGSRESKPTNAEFLRMLVDDARAAEVAETDAECE